MPLETPNDFNLTPKEMDEVLSRWQDENYLRQLASQEAAHDSDETTRKVLELAREGRPEGESPGKQPANFREIFEKNVSPSKQIPVRSFEESLADKEQTAQREAEQGHTTLTGARKKQFGERIPIVEDGRVIDFEDRPGQVEIVKEVRKGTPSRKVHKSRTTVSSRTHPALSPRVRAQPGYDKESDPSYPRLFE